MNSNPASFGPIQSGDRIEAMDVLRGFALLGILLMNIEAFVGPLMAALTAIDPNLAGADRWVDAAVYVLVQGKFVTMFSLLFGMGFAVMLDRAQVHGASGRGTYARRLLALLGIGLVHAWLIWSGDILVMYALLGFVMLLFFSRTPASRLRKWAIAIYLVPVLLGWSFVLMQWAAQADPTAAAEFQKAMAQQSQQMSTLITAEREAYGAGSYAQATAQRFVDFGFMLSGMMFFGPAALGMFLFGAWFIRSGLMWDTAAHLPMFRKLLAAGIFVGLPLMLLSTWLEPHMEFSKLNVQIAIARTSAAIANLLMCFGYVSAIILLLHRPAWQPGLQWLAPAGRMALSNYLLQSVVCTLVFYGYGLGYFERLPRAWQPLFVIALFAVQVVISRWWLSNYRFGPVEWVWRWLTYGKRPAMRYATA